VTILAGFRVVELGLWVAGPGAGGVLADWGADVVKVEPPAGDPMRELFAHYSGAETEWNPPFDLDNRGKRSVVLDLASDRGAAAMGRLLDGADVFLTNLRPDALERLGLDHATVLATRPRLVYASVTGFGLDGPDRDRAAYDVGAFWARGGGAALQVPPGAEPQAIRGGFGDHITAMSAVAGVMAALLARERTGKGQLVATSLLRAGIYCVGWDLGVQLRFGRLASTRLRGATANPLINAYRTSDGRWFWLLGLEADRHWPKLVKAIGSPAWAVDERLEKAAARAKDAEDVIARLDGAFGEATLAEWAERFDAVDMWWAPVQTPKEVIADPQANAVGAFVEVPGNDGEEPYRAVATPVSFGAAAVGPTGPSPRLGQHTDEVLRELGM
jgi:crotonobetainyl-CoA:carnitine CoA-transferase CaiB-like acyl-CoA transferase